MRREIFGPEHDAFRASARAFLEKEAIPNIEDWEAAGMVDRSFWTKAAAQGFVGFEAPDEYGGADVKDFRFNAILDEEVAYAGAVGDNFSLQNDIICPYLVDLTTDDQKARWLPAFTRGEQVWAIAMSEPGMGSDLRAMTTTAAWEEDAWVINGSKTFVTSGIQADIVIVAAVHGETSRRGRMSLFAVGAETEGFTRGRKLRKIGRCAQDTAELFFDSVRVPPENLLGRDGHGLEHLKAKLAQERMSMAAKAVAVAEAALDLTIAYCRERETFGRPIGTHQAVRFMLAEMRTEVDVARAYVDRCIASLVASELAPSDAAAAKLFSTEMQFRVVDTCLQLHGGYGYMEEYPIARIWRDSRVQRIYGGTSEIMKEIIGRSMGF
jgi:acyl-CoA dehydrogenase